MKPPAEFIELAGSFYPGSRTREMTLQDQIDTVIVRKTPEQRQISKKHLTGLLAGDASDEDLKKIWDDTDPTYGFTRGIRHFLTLLRDAL